MSNTLSIVRRWSDADDTLTANEISDAMKGVRAMGKKLCGLDAESAYRIVEFYADNAMDCTDSDPIRELLEHEAVSVERAARERLILTFHDIEAVCSLIQRIDKKKADEDIMSLTFILKCALLHDSGSEIVTAVSTCACDHPLPQGVANEITSELCRGGFDGSRVFGRL